MHRVFVYGTIKKGFANHDRIFAGHNIKITPAWTYGELYDLGYFPALTDGNNKIYGELIEFDDPEILRMIDWLEGYKGKDEPFNFYERREIQVFTEREKITTWAYFLNKSKMVNIDVVIIFSGVWAK